MAVLAAIAGVGAPGRSGAEDIPFLKSLRHPLIVGAEECAECHRSEVKAWQLTDHFHSRDLHLNDKAGEIAEKMGIGPASRVRTSALCSQCHFTVQKMGDKPAKAIAGVSCESCHGGALNWIDIHNTGDRREPDDTTEDRSRRVAESAAAGLLGPVEIHKIAENCYRCHLVTDEALVNRGGHPPGSDGFELVSWLSGEVRHNFFDSKGGENRPLSPARRRVLYIVGRALEMEYSLRGLARATEKAEYGNAMGRRCVETRKALDAIADALGADTPAELREIRDAIGTPGLLKFFNVAPLEAAADAIEKQVALLVANHDGSRLGAVDALIPGEAIGKPHQP
ncbi:MAG: cytochrome c family protein [Verrucomicrobiae bacterium]|nr:cytochrome c family protein [Verrucomicrobiae bacterium]